MVKAPEGSTYVRTENPLGQLGYWLESDGGRTPWRLKMRTPSFSNVQAIPYLLKGVLVPTRSRCSGPSSSSWETSTDDGPRPLDQAVTFAPQSASLLDLGDGFLLSLALKIAFVLGLFFVVPLVGGYLEHKVMGRMQARRGPVEAGPVRDAAAGGRRHQVRPEGRHHPAGRGQVGLRGAPGVALVPGMLIFLVIPLGPGVFALDLELGLFYALAISSISVLGILMGGLGQREQVLVDRWPARGRPADRLRAAADPRGDHRRRAGGHPVAGRDRRGAGHVHAARHRHQRVVRLPPDRRVRIFFVAAMAELSRPPFDMPIADSELVFGYMTEYTGHQVRDVPADRVRRDDHHVRTDGRALPRRLAVAARRPAARL
jgi:hypothetical protein